MEYAGQANQFYKEAWEQNYPKLEYPNVGRIGLYDPATNRFGVYDPQGKTITFYKRNSESIILKSLLIHNYCEEEGLLRLYQSKRKSNLLIQKFFFHK